MSRVQALKRYAVVFSGLPKPRHRSHLPYFGCCHTNISLCNYSHFSALFGACKDARRMYVRINTISLPLATCCSQYRDTSPFRAVATIDIIIFTKSSGGVAEKFANPSFVGSFAKPFCHQPAPVDAAALQCVLPWNLDGLCPRACWISQLCMVLDQTHAFLSRCSTSSCLALRTSRAFNFPPFT